MAKIPQFGNMMLNGARSHVPDVYNGVPEAINTLANVLAQKKQEDDQLLYQKALLDLDEFGSNELNDPDSGYKNLQGENAINEAGNYNQRYTDKVSEIRESLKGNSFLDRFDLQSQDMHTSYARQLMSHEGQQKSALAMQTMKSGIDLAITKAQTLYGDPTALSMEFNNLMSRIDEFSAEQGMPAELRKAQKDELAQQYFAAALDGWVAHTELSKGNFSALAANMKKSLPYNQLTDINKAKYMLKVDSMVKRQGNENKDSLSLDLNNAWAMQQRGIVAPDIPLARFNAVYGAKGKQAYDAYQDKQVLANNIGAMQNMPTSELINLTKEDIAQSDNDINNDLTANTQNKNFSERLGLQSVRAKAARNLLTQRSDDPIAAAYQAGEVEDIDLSQDSLSQRVAQATRISQDYQTPLRVFSNKEAESISNFVNNASSTQQVELIRLMANTTNGNDKAYNAMLNDIGLQNPVFAVAGNILSSQVGNQVTVKERWFTSNVTVDKQSTAAFILKGAEALKGTGKGGAKIQGVSLPPKSIEAFDNVAGSLFIDDPISKQTVYSAAMSYYVGKSISTGTYSNTHEIDTDLLTESINAVAGEKSSRYNVRRPWGMDESTFTNQVEMQYSQIAKANGWVESDNLKNYNYDPADPYGVTQKSLQSRFELVPSTYASGIPDGKYFLKAGNGFLKDNNGNPVVIDALRTTKYVAESIKDIPE